MSEREGKERGGGSSVASLIMHDDILDLHR